MAVGSNHDKGSILWSIPFGLLTNLIIGSPYGLITGIAFLLGGLWLSPDLDTKSLPLKRWGILKGIWLPYRKLIPHRSFFSHGPLIGTTLRICYLITCTTLVVLLIQPFGLKLPINIIQYLSQNIQANPKPYLALFLGLEASAWLHLIKDGDPLPKEWS